MRVLIHESALQQHMFENGRLPLGPYTRLQQQAGTKVPSLIRNSAPLGPYSKTLPKALRCFKRGGVFLWTRYPCKRSTYFELGKRQKKIWKLYCSNIYTVYPRISPSRYAPE